MLSIEIRAGGTAQTLPLPGKLVLGASHGVPEGALELEPRLDGAIAVCRTPDARIGAHKLPANVRRLVRPGESIQLGEAAVSVIEELDLTTPQTRLLARAMLRGTPPPVKPGVPSIVWLNGPDLGRRVVLMEEATFLGRGEGCAARVNDAQASRMHAKLVRAPEGIKLVDLMSANGVLVNGERVVESRLLCGGETIQIGNTLIGFEKPLEPRRPTPPPAKVVVEAPKPAPVAEAKPEPKPEPAAEPEEPKAPAKPRKPMVTSFEVALIGLAVFALGAGGAVIAWAVR